MRGSPARIRAGGVVTVTSLWRSTWAVAVADAIQRLSGRPLFQGTGKLQLSTLWPSDVSGPAASVQPDGAACWPISCSSRGTGLRCARLCAALQEKQRGVHDCLQAGDWSCYTPRRPVDRPGSRSVGRSVPRLLSTAVRRKG